MRVAIVHDWLTSVGGAENVLRELLVLYPEADIYTLVYRKSVLRALGIPSSRVRASFIQRLPFSTRKYRWYFPWFPFAVEQFDLRAYDLVLSDSHCVAKGVLTHPAQLHICYCHSPVRYAWDLYFDYIARYEGRMIAWVLRWCLHGLRRWDIVSACRPDYFIANSQYIARRIAHIYRREAQVIYPPVHMVSCELPEVDKPYYITVSRLVIQKKVDLIVRAFLPMTDRSLLVVGVGPEYKALCALVKYAPHIRLLGYKNQSDLRACLLGAKGFIFMAEEDFGIAPVEAQACGVPVLAYGKGGVCESVQPGETGLFFPKQCAVSLQDALPIFERHRFDRKYIQAWAQQFQAQRFRNAMAAFVQSKLEETRKL